MGSSRLTLIGVRSDAEIDRAFSTFARESHNGAVVLPAIFTTAHREAIIASAAKYRIPTIYGYRFFVASGGLVSYGIDSIDQFYRAASYVDRILKGAKPTDLPVQAPTKYELVINPKTAKTLGLKISPTVFARADEVIE